MLNPDVLDSFSVPGVDDVEGAVPVQAVTRKSQHQRSPGTELFPTFLSRRVVHHGEEAVS